MYIHQLYTNCLAHAAYYIESQKEVAIIDPLRDIETYIELASERGAKIKYILETHFHADFVSGHLDLAKKTGATIVFGKDATPGYTAHIAEDGEILPLGNVKIKVLHTPGHTIESACYLLLDENGKEDAVFTGDTLFVGDVGRPDLLSGNLDKEHLAAMLYDSLEHKIKTLGDNVLVYPGHGPGSACGKNIGKETSSTIGIQKLTNYALKAHDKDDFIRQVASDLPVPPAYFFSDAAINKKGYRDFDEVITQNLKPLSIDAFKNEVKQGATILDTRDAVVFGKAFIPGSINVGLNGSFASWVGTILPVDTPIILVTSEGKEKECITRLARVGFENIKGYLQGGINIWMQANQSIEHVHTVTSMDYDKFLSSTTYKLLDVRNEREAEHNKIGRSILIPLNQLQAKVGTFNKAEKYLVYCAGGYRSMIAASILKANGIKNVLNIEGGIGKVKQVAPQLVEEF